MSTQSPNASMAEFGAGLDGEEAQKFVPKTELRGDYDAARVHEVADAVDTVREAADRLGVRFCDAKHDLARVDRYDEFQSAQDLVEKLREQGESETNEFAKYKRGGE